MFKNLLLVTLLAFTVSFPGLGQKPGPLTALELDGTDDYISIPDVSAINPTAKITVEAWIKADAWGVNFYTNSIFCKHGWATGNKGYVLRCGDNGKLSFNISNASGVWMEAVSSSIMKTGVWYHVAGTFNGDTISVYINGNLEASTVYSGSISVSTGLPARIGDLANGGGRWFDGQIDEIKVWGTALSKATLRNWMCRKVTKSHPDYSSLGGYWKLDEGSGTNVYDQSANGNTGVLTNGPQWVNSGAALGDSSVYVYGSSGMAMKTKYGDVFSIRNIAGSPVTVHAYVNYGANKQPLGVVGTIDTTHYFGVYYVDNTSTNFDINYNFKNYSQIPGIKCEATMFVKNPGNLGTWINTGAKLTAGDSLMLKKQTNKEYLMAFLKIDTAQIIFTENGIKWFCDGDSLSITALANDSFDYAWYKNGALLNGKTKRELWATSAGNYKVKITRKGTLCSFTSSTIAISSRGTPVSWNFSLNTCQNSDSVMLTPGTPSGGYYSGKWVTPNGYFHPQKAGAGKHTLTYNYADADNCINKASVTATLLDTAKLTVTPIQGICYGPADITLNNVSPAGGTYQGSGVSGNMFSVLAAGPGTHTINYLYTQTNACKSKALFNILIHKPDSISVSMKDKVCLNDEPVDVRVYPPGGIIKNPSVVGKTFYPLFAGAGLHWIYYTITDSHLCGVMDSAKIYVSDMPKAVLLPFASVCDNSPGFKLSGGQPADSGKYYLDGVLNDNFNPSLKGKGVYKIEYKVVNYFGCRDSALGVIRVKESPLKPVISITGNTLNSSVVKGIQWLDKNGPIPGANQQNYKPLADGYYFLKVTNDSNCSKTSDSVQFKKVSIISADLPGIFIYPNPSQSGIFTVTGLPVNYKIRVYDPVGKEILFLKETPANSKLDLGVFGPGTYFLSFMGEGKRYSYRLVVLQ